jgi:hypothetical protein
MIKTVWLVDIGYVTKASKGRGKVDYLKTKQFLESKFSAPCLSMLFNGVDERFGIDLGLKQFYHTMEREGFVVKLYPMEGGAQKQVDVAISSYLVYYALKGHTIVLSSGDRDFLPALQVARMEDTDTQITLLTFDFGVHEDISKLSSEHLFFEALPEILRK